MKPILSITLAPNKLTSNQVKKWSTYVSNQLGVRVYSGSSESRWGSTNLIQGGDPEKREDLRKELAKLWEKFSQLHNLEQKNDIECRNSSSH